LNTAISNSESRALFQAMLMLFELLMAVFNLKSSVESTFE
jgi:hypothetical protein